MKLLIAWPYPLAHSNFDHGSLRLLQCLQLQKILKVIWLQWWRKIWLIFMFFNPKDKIYKLTKLPHASLNISPQGISYKRKYIPPAPHCRLPDANPFSIHFKSFHPESEFFTWQTPEGAQVQKRPPPVEAQRSEQAFCDSTGFSRMLLPS